MTCGFSEGRKRILKESQKSNIEIKEDYWYEERFIKGINDKLLLQISKHNRTVHGLIGITPVYSEWL